MRELGRGWLLTALGDHGRRVPWRDSNELTSLLRQALLTEEPARDEWGTGRKFIDGERSRNV